jgi:hypothetical protein
MASLTISSQFNRHQSRRAFNSCYIPAMSYSLTEVNLHENQINQIQKAAITSYIQKCGYDMHFPRKVVYSPVTRIKKSSVESNCQKIESLICHINTKSSLGKSMELILNWVQLHSGLSTSILSNNSDIQYVKLDWFSPIREFLYSINGKIILQTIWLPQKKRINDVNIMDRVSELPIN